MENGEIKLTAIARMADEDAIDQLIKLKGIGRWSAEVYLLFVLRRTDIWPVDDLGIVKGLMKLKGLSVRPSRESLISLAEEWRPWRSVAARLLWHYVNSLDENRKKSK